MGYTFGIQWNDKLIKEEILKVMEVLNINRMPSSDEMKLVTGNTKLTNAIRRHGGYLFWAASLNLEQSECETRTGFKEELNVKALLESKGYKVEKNDNQASI